MLQPDTLESSSGEIPVTDVEGPVLSLLLAYMYTLQAPQVPRVAPKLLAAADRYGLLALKGECEKQLVAQLAVETAAATAVLAVRHSCRNLTSAVVAFIKANLGVMATQGWADAMRNEPRELIEVSRLLAEPSEETKVPTTTPGTHNQPHSNQGQTPVTATLPTPPHHDYQFDNAAISHMRDLSEEEKGRRLIQAAEQGSVEKVRLLLKAGAGVGAVEEGNWTALHCAAERGHVEVVRCLIDGGAEVDARTKWQHTPLHLAAICGHTDVVRLLVASRADLNPRDHQGMTPLHWAVDHGNSEVVAALLEAGADTEGRDERGDTALDCATRVNRQELIKILSRR
ncbi:ankyrin repeat and protein kinase domain-containing protein 1-like [Schistocerca gregaria]|uniref:ankyrin repeat and protein kinase domain-containing protein 1-like n=1 Tax=Schistocerca gregaria TaxID=7010 RepID=UPI00211EE3C3|nr:ankyrin repeat and protein kinase domain-containing protein 1-like [Schistocerca gregaria]